MPLTFNNLENITKQLYEAARSRSICSFKLQGEGSYRMIHTHGVFMSKHQKLTLCCWQRSGYSAKGELEGYKNLPLEKCENVLVLSRRFVKRRDFNPESSQYGEWLFHV
jgi:hypothetical protein